MPKLMGHRFNNMGMYSSMDADRHTEWRATVGSFVKIRSTANTRQYARDMIGKVYKIVTDVGGHQPYQVENFCVWFYETDVDQNVQALGERPQPGNLKPGQSKPSQPLGDGGWPEKCPPWTPQIVAAPPAPPSWSSARTWPPKWETPVDGSWPLTRESTTDSQMLTREPTTESYGFSREPTAESYAFSREATAEMAFVREPMPEQTTWEPSSYSQVAERQAHAWRPEAPEFHMPSPEYSAWDATPAWGSATSTDCHAPQSQPQVSNDDNFGYAAVEPLPAQSRPQALVVVTEDSDEYEDEIRSVAATEGGSASESASPEAPAGLPPLEHPSFKLGGQQVEVRLQGTFLHVGEVSPTSRRAKSAPSVKRVEKHDAAAYQDIGQMYIEKFCGDVEKLYETVSPKNGKKTSDAPQSFAFGEFGELDIDTAESVSVTTPAYDRVRSNTWEDDEPPSAVSTAPGGEAADLDALVAAMPANHRELLKDMELGSADLPTVGSAGHYFSYCKPCCFAYTKGCANGVSCIFCHLCDPGEKKRRQKERYEKKKRQWRQLCEKRQAHASSWRREDV